jgi:FkbM family methyltransferase
MKESCLKHGLKKFYFPSGAVRRIRMGPLRGQVFRVSDVTGMSPWYSGAERDHQETFKKLIEPGDVAIDIGANWGLHTLYLSRLVGPDGLVIALEPFAPAFAELEWHIRANHCRNVKLIQYAISDAGGKALFAAGDSASTGSLVACDARSFTQKDEISVTVQQLDFVVEELGLKKLRLVKVDVEGAESRVLLGSKRTIERYRPYFVIDLHTPEQDVSVADLLTSYGYRLSRLSGPPIQRTDKGWPDVDGVWGTILATPSA